MCVALVIFFRLVALRPWRVTFEALAHALADLRLMTKNCELLTDAENSLVDPPPVTSHFQAHLPRGRTIAVVRSTTVVNGDFKTPAPPTQPATSIAGWTSWTWQGDFTAARTTAVSFDAGGASAMLQGWAPGKFAIQQDLTLTAGTFEVSAMVAACVKPPHLSFLMPKVAVVLGHGAALLSHLLLLFFLLFTTLASIF